MGGGGGGSRGAAGGQTPGQDPARNAKDIQDLFNQLDQAGMLPQAAPQRAPAQMDPSMVVDSLMKAGRTQDLGTQLGTYRPTVWAQQRGITGPAPVNVLSSQTRGAMAPLMQGQLQTQNQNQLIDFLNTQATAKTGARNLGVAGATGTVAAERTGQLNLQVAQAYADAMMKRMAATQVFSQQEQNAMGTFQEMSRALEENRTIRDKYKAQGLGSLTGYFAGPTGIINRLKALTGMGGKDEFATDAQTFNNNVQYMAKEYARQTMMGRTPTQDILQKIATSRIPGGDPTETDQTFDNKHASMTSEIAGRQAAFKANKPFAGARRDATNQPGTINAGMGATNEDPGQPTMEPDYSGNTLAGDTTVPQAGDKGQNVNPAKGGLNPTERARMIQLRAKRGAGR
jgi:hypothetical protein